MSLKVSAETQRLRALIEATTRQPFAIEDTDKIVSYAQQMLKRMAESGKPMLVVGGSEGAPCTMLGETRVWAILDRSQDPRLYRREEPSEAAAEILYAFDPMAVEPYACRHPSKTNLYAEREMELYRAVQGVEDVIRTHAVCRAHDGTYYCIQDYANQGNLEVFLQKQPQLPLGIRAHLALHLLTAVTGLHLKKATLRGVQGSIVHRDIKPQNVLIHQAKSGDLQLMLTDFAQSALNTEARQFEILSGTAAWMAPEIGAILRVPEVSRKTERMQEILQSPKEPFSNETDYKAQSATHQYAIDSNERFNQRFRSSTDIYGTGLVLGFLLTQQMPASVREILPMTSLSKMANIHLSRQVRQWDNLSGIAKEDLSNLQDPELVDLLEKMTKFLCTWRPTAEDVLKHPAIPKLAKLAQTRFAPPAEQPAPQPQKPQEGRRTPCSLCSSLRNAMCSVQ